MSHFQVTLMLKILNVVKLKHRITVKTNTVRNVRSNVVFIVVVKIQRHGSPHACLVVLPSGLFKMELRNSRF